MSAFLFLNSMRAKLLFFLAFTSLTAFGQSNIESTKMSWFKDAKLGIFIHWGIYAVNGVSESWSFYNEQISYEDYLNQLKGFTAKNYHPILWADLIKESGAKYAVITSKHHDGFALWDSKYGHLNARNHSAAKTDVLSPFIESIRKNDLKVGLYFSLPDWSHSDYTHHTKNNKRYAIKEDTMRWNHFTNYFTNQLDELGTRYNPDLWWFDGDWEHNAKEWGIQSIKTQLRKYNHEVIFNSRLCGEGDYKTPEIGIPITRPNTDFWELCVTMNDSWGYFPTDSNYKSPQQVIDLFVDCISKGGNLLLDIGPKADGTIPKEQIHILRELGKWNKKHQEAIYNTISGIPYDHFYGPTSLSKDSTQLYLYVRDIPKNGELILKGINNEIKQVSIVGTGTKLNHKIFCKVSWNTYPGINYITMPVIETDNYCTVIKIEFDTKIDLYQDP